MDKNDISKRSIYGKQYQRYCPTVNRNVVVEDVIDVSSGENCVMCHNKHSCEQTGGCKNNLFGVWNA